MKYRVLEKAIYEKEINDSYKNQRAIFDINKFNKLEKEDFTLTTDKLFWS